MKISPALQVAFHNFNAGTANARADYHAHPTAACRRHECERLADNDMLCRHHRAELTERTTTRRKERAA